MKTKPTPTPWYVENTQDHTGITSDLADWNSLPKRVCSLPRPTDHWVDYPKTWGDEGPRSRFELTPEGVEQLERNRANAELIVRAVNCHEEFYRVMSDLLFSYAKEIDPARREEVLKLLAKAKGP